jgi:hypothetical protein
MRLEKLIDGAHGGLDPSPQTYHRLLGRPNASFLTHAERSEWVMLAPERVVRPSRRLASTAKQRAFDDYVLFLKARFL